MGRISSAAGDVAFNMKSIRTDTNGFVIVGRMGVWDAEVYLSYKEIVAGFGKPMTLLAVLKIPLLLLKDKLHAWQLARNLGGLCWQSSKRHPPRP